MGERRAQEGRRGSSGDPEDAFDLDRDAQRQGDGRDGGAGMAARVAEDLDQQVGGAVDHLAAGR